MNPPEEATTYTEEDLSGMTIAEIKELAVTVGIPITARKKADIIAEFLAGQN